MSIRLRMAAVFTLLVSVILVLVGVLTYQLLRGSLLDEIGRDVTRRAESFSKVGGGPPYALDTFTSPDVFLQVVGPDGTVSARSANLGARTLPVSAEAARGQVVEARVDDRPLLLTTAPLASGGSIVVARSPVTTYGALRELRQLLTAVIAAAALLTALASWLYARAALRPVERVVEAARLVRDSRDLSRRVDRRGPRDEVGRLVETFNGMLAELQQAADCLDQSNQRMRQFLADCSHELRAPLTRIRSTMDLLGRLGEDDPEFRSAAIADVAAETDRMARMVRQLLLLARADAGASVRRRPVRLSDTITAACRQARRMADGVALDAVDGHAMGEVTVAGDADHLEQLILILLDNAFKYTPAPGTVQLTAATDGDNARITVSDTGLGIPAEDLPRVFDRFYRGRNANSATGTGLGLAIAKWIAEQHKGRIEVSSRPGEGSAFTVRLPILAAANPHEPGDQ